MRRSLCDGLLVALPFSSYDSTVSWSSIKKSIFSSRYASYGDIVPLVSISLDILHFQPFGLDRNDSPVLACPNLTCPNLT